MWLISALLALDIALDLPIREGIIPVEGKKYVAGMLHVTLTMKAIKKEAGARLTTF